MKRRIKMLVAVFLVIFIIVGVAFVSLSSGTQKIEESIDINKTIASGTANNDVSAKEYTLMLENEKLQFWMNSNTTEFKIVNRFNGSEWYSSNKNRSDGSSETAPIQLSYLNSQGGLSDMDVMTGSVAEGKYIIEQSDDKVTVRYSIGDFSELVLIPYALTEKRFKEIKESLKDEFEQMKLIDLYYLTDIKIIEDKDLKKKRLQEYPMLESQPLYIIRDSVKDDPLAKKDVAAIFSEAGYTQEDYNSDSKYFKADKNTEKTPGFNITVEYTLNGGKFNVKIPYDCIEMHSEFPITSLTFAPYFGSPNYGENGWFLLPDGSGSLMNFYNGKSNQVYRTTVYGQEKTQNGRENLNNDLGASLPVFGIQNDGSGLLCEISDGDAISQVVAYSGDKADAAYAHAVFNLRSTYKSTTATGKKESFITIQKQRYTGDISLDYNFIDSNNTSLSDMASVVRKSIFGTAKESTSASMPVMLEQIGLVTRQNQFLGIAYNEKVGLTDFKRSYEITDFFLKNGIDNMSVVFSGWFGDGVEHKFLSKRLSASKLLGGDKALVELLNKMKTINVPLYLDADVQYTGKTGLFDGFSKTSDTATMLDQSTGRLKEYDFASFMQKTGNFKYINNAAAQSKSITVFKSSAEKYKVKNISLRTIGSELSADYGTATVDRQEMANSVGEWLKELTESGYQITTQGVNAYALPYISNASDVPVESSGFDTTDMSVPFLQMVIGGYLNYYAPALNLSGDVQTALLKAVSSGSGLSCVITAQNGDKLTNSNQNYLFSTDYNYWKNNLAEKIVDFQRRLAPVAGKRIVNYEKLAESVYKTTYENGIDVIVNYSGKPFANSYAKVKAKDFVLRGDVS